MYSHNPLAVESPSQSEGQNWTWWTLRFAIVSMLVGAAIAYLVGETGLFSLLITPIIILIIIAVLYPELALLGLLLVVYMNLSDVLINFHGLPSIARPVVGVVLGIVLIRAAVFKDRFHGWRSFVFLVAVYGLTGIIPMLIATDYEGISLTSQDYIKDVFIGLEVILLIRTTGNLKHAVWILLLAGLLMGSLTFYQQMTSTLDNP